MEIGRIFATSLSMLRQRFWPLLGMWLLFLAIQIVGMVVLVLVVGVGLGATAGLASGLENPGALAGLGIGTILMLVAVYAAYIVLLLAQQAAMVTLASPLEEPSFGGALSRGFKSALPFLGITVILLVGYLLFALVIGGVGVAAGGGEVFRVVMPLLFLPALIYLACRFAVLVPVVAVDQVFNPIAALQRSWAVTSGKVLSILLAFIGFILLSMLLLGVPLALLLGGTFAAQDNEGTAAGIVIFGFLFLIPLFIVYTLFASAFSGALHAAVTGGQSDQMEDVFA